MQVTWQRTRKPVSILMTSAFLFSVLALGSCKTPTNRFDYKPDGTRPDGPFKPTPCAASNQTDGVDSITILELALNTFAFVTPAAAAIPAQDDTHSLLIQEAVRIAGGGDGGC